MTPTELNENNYKRIFLINTVLIAPLFLVFAWPYAFLCSLADIGPWIRYPGAILFAYPFVMTILHGHVTMALGSLHRHHYYNWLSDNPLSFGLFFHEWLISTRFRLAVFLLSVVLLLAAYWIT